MGNARPRQPRPQGGRSPMAAEVRFPFMFLRLRSSTLHRDLVFDRGRSSGFSRRGFNPSLLLFTSNRAAQLDFPIDRIYLDRLRRDRLVATQCRPHLGERIRRVDPAGNVCQAWFRVARSRSRLDFAQSRTTRRPITIETPGSTGTTRGRRTRGFTRVRPLGSGFFRRIQI